MTPTDSANTPGRAWIFGDNVSTDLIFPGRYVHLLSNMPELVGHTLEDARTDYAPNVKPGDFVVAGENFGMGSSREQAPVIIKLSGARAVLAKSFARIFFRNAINIGLAAIEVDTTGIKDGDKLTIDLEAGVLKDQASGIERRFEPLPPIMTEILRDGGLIEHIKKHGDINL
ncbi:MAG: 3-isopropylmalate dehydratase small subunit [candidate division Zixibacteria bacterium]|nr:3-isopropylmalate dehydratase small subunit [candidate division Zixibacteria bacterium]